MLALLTYIGVGVGLATAGLCVPSLGRQIKTLSAHLGMSINYGRAAWFGGTVVAWPIGLYVLVTGRLILVENNEPKPTDDATIKAKAEDPWSSETGG